MLMERFRRAHPPAYDPNERRMVAPVLALQMASYATERRFYGQLLTAIGAPFAPRATVLDLEVPGSAEPAAYGCKGADA